jgi:hypothetical protein
MRVRARHAPYRAVKGLGALLKELAELSLVLRRVLGEERPPGAAHRQQQPRRQRRRRRPRRPRWGQRLSSRRPFDCFCGSSYCDGNVVVGFTARERPPNPEPAWPALPQRRRWEASPTDLVNGRRRRAPNAR